MPAGLLIVVLAFIVLYFVLVRPQKRKQVAQRQKLEDLNVGDEVLTAGGIYGEITGFQYDDLLVEIAPQLEVRVARRAIGAVFPRGEEDGDAIEEPEESEEAEAPPTVEPVAAQSPTADDRG